MILLKMKSGIVKCESNPTNEEVILHDYDIQEPGEYEAGKDENGLYAVIRFPPEGTPAESRYGREPEKMKSLARYLSEYLATGIDRAHETGMPVDYTEEGLQALDAYQSTENVTIKIERV